MGGIGCAEVVGHLRFACCPASVRLEPDFDIRLSKRQELGTDLILADHRTAL